MNDYTPYVPTLRCEVLRWSTDPHDLKRLDDNRSTYVSAETIPPAPLPSHDATVWPFSPTARYPRPLRDAS